MKKQQGFSVAILIVILVVITGLGLAGYWVFLNNRDTQTTPNVETQNQSTDNQADLEVVEEDPSLEGYAVIQEWGIKIAMRDYDKLTFDVSNEPNKFSFEDTYATGRANPIFKPEHLLNECSPGLSLYRSDEEPSYYRSKKVGDYYYFITGGPGRCGEGDPSDPDYQLHDRFLKDFSLENLSAIE